jgi:hypothetical protein
MTKFGKMPLRPRRLLNRAQSIKRRKGNVSTLSSSTCRVLGGAHNSSGHRSSSFVIPFSCHLIPRTVQASKQSLRARDWLADVPRMRGLNSGQETGTMRRDCALPWTTPI